MEEKKKRNMRIIFLILGGATVILMLVDMIRGRGDTTNHIMGLVSGLCLLGGAFGIYEEKKEKE